MKKNLVTLLLALAIVSPAAAFAAEAESTVISAQPTEETEQEQQTIVTKTIETEADAAELTNEETVIIGKDGKTVDKLAAGDIVTVNTEENIAVVSDGNVDIDTYFKSNEDEFGALVNASNTLSLNIGDKTEIVDIDGNAVSKDELDCKVLVVFYDISTRSIPAQTTPSKIVVVREKAEEAAETVYTDVFVKSEDFGDYIDAHNTLALNIGDNTVIVDEKGNPVSKDELDGMTLEVHYSFTTMSIPAQTTPSKIVVREMADEAPGDAYTDVFVKSGEYDFGDYIDAHNTLALNIGDNTVIVDEEGNAVSKDELGGKTLEVYYSIMTMSIPAQTNPTKIVVKGNDKSAVLKRGENVYTEKYTVKDEKKYIPLRNVAEGLGITVSWTDETKTIVLDTEDAKASVETKGNADLYIEEGHTFMLADVFESCLADFGVKAILN